MVSRSAKQNGSLSDVRRQAPSGTGREKLAELPTEEKGRRTRAEGIALCLAPAKAAKEGARILIYGRTRWGKSCFARHLINAARSDGIASTVLISDPKYPDRAQYDGTMVHAPTGIGPALASGAETLVLRPGVSVADGAAACRWLAESGEPCLLLVDETRRALAGQQRWIDAGGPDGPQAGPRNLEWICLEGGGVRASLVLLVQRPRQLPGDAVDSAQIHVCFGLGGRSLAYLLDAGTVPKEASETIKRLPPGAFVVLSDDEEWDRRVYYSPL
jgi:hypothetical protein